MLPQAFEVWRDLRYLFVAKLLLNVPVTKCQLKNFENWSVFMTLCQKLGGLMFLDHSVHILEDNAEKLHLTAQQYTHSNINVYDVTIA